MPNWVKNKIIVGSNKLGKELIKKYTILDEYDEVEFDFNKVIPMPKELQIEFSSKSNRALCLYLTKINPLVPYYGDKKNKLNEKEFINLTNKVKEKTMGIEFSVLNLAEIEESIEEYGEDGLLSLGKAQIDNITKYGAINWYDWAIDNWGTKWNANHFKSLEDEKILTFETAWDPAIPVFLEMSRQNPDIKFAFLYADESIGSHVGYVLAKAGNIDYKGTFEDYSVDAYKLAFDLWDCADEYVYDEESGTYIYKEDSEESEKDLIN